MSAATSSLNVHSEPAHGIENGVNRAGNPAPAQQTLTADHMVSQPHSQPADFNRQDAADFSRMADVPSPFEGQSGPANNGGILPNMMAWLGLSTNKTPASAIDPDVLQAKLAAAKAKVKAGYQKELVEADNHATLPQSNLPTPEPE